MKRKVSDLIAEFLKAKGMKHVFGIVGSGNSHIFDSITRLGATEIVCPHHEQAACMAMQSYYRTCGTVTAALVTTGAGSLNAITGVVGAWADSIPGLIISSNENAKHTRADNPLRMWGVQGFDSVAMVSKVTKYAVRVLEPERVLYELEKAYALTTAGRPGPCWVDVPLNVQSSLVEEKDLVRFDPKELDSARPKPPAPRDVEKIWKALASAERPVLWLGHGIRLAGALDELEKVLDLARAPFLVSWAGIDMVDSGHPMNFGRAGVYGQRAANFVLQNCDFLLAIGTRLAIPQVGYEISELARSAKIAVVDVDETELAKYRERWETALAADARDFLRASVSCLKKKPIAAPKAWIARCEKWRRDYPWVGPEHKDEGGFINSYPFMEKLSRHLKPDQIVVTDMGTALLSGHQNLRLKPGQRLMTSTGLGEMGYGLPGAVGASIARDGGEVMCLNCDGGMMLNLQELQTIVHHKLPIKIFVFNNDGYLMIKHTQKSLFGGRYSGTDKKSGVTCPDFSKIAKAFDLPAYRIRTWKDFDRVIPKVQAAKGALICEVFMHPEQYFVPKLSLAVRKDGSLVSPPLEDLSPFLPREEMRRNMIAGLHPKSEKIGS